MYIHLFISNDLVRKLGVSNFYRSLSTYINIYSDLKTSLQLAYFSETSKYENIGIRLCFSDGIINHGEIYMHTHTHTCTCVCVCAHSYIWTLRCLAIQQTYIDQLCVGNECNLEDLSGVMADRDRW